MKNLLAAALIAAIGVSFAGHVQAQNSKPIECGASPLHLQHVGRCSIETRGAEKRTLYRNNGPIAGGGFSMVLFFADQGAFVSEGAPGSTERYLQSFNETVKNEARNWSAFAYDDGILHAQFDYRGSRCAAFSKHGPPAGGGYQWLLAGYHCQPGATEPLEELKNALRFTRVGKPAGPDARDAFGKQIAAEASYSP